MVDDRHDLGRGAAAVLGEVRQEAFGAIHAVLERCVGVHAP
jgi:hypothetical protein